jgi:hypothetical protein
MLMHLKPLTCYHTVLPVQSVVCTAAYLLGEYGRLIKEEVLPMDQFRLLNSLFPAASQNAKGLLMTAFIKIYLLAPQVKRWFMYQDIPGRLGIGSFTSD